MRVLDATGGEWIGKTARRALDANALFRHNERTYAPYLDASGKIAWVQVADDDVDALKKRVEELEGRLKAVLQWAADPKIIDWLQDQVVQKRIAGLVNDKT